MAKYPDKGLIVKTKDHVYRLGKPNQDGIRSIERDDGDVIGFYRCKIVHLEIGFWMALNTLDSAKANWFTDVVEEIIEEDG